MKRFVLLLSLLEVSTAALAAPAATDLERIVNSVALTLDGVILNCPAPYKTLGAETRRCVAAERGVGEVRRQLSASKLDLYGAWRSKDSPTYVYNWVKAADGYVSVFVGPNGGNAAGSIVYLNIPEAASAARSAAPATVSGASALRLSRPSTASASTSGRAATAPGKPDKPDAPAGGDAASPAAATFQRVLRLNPAGQPRMNGADVRALQNRLIDLSSGERGAGDGWYGPVTEATVIVFQQTNRLPATGVVDRATWERVFSAAARPFDVAAVRALAEQRR